MDEKQKEIRLKQLEKVNKKLETETDPIEYEKLVETGKFLISIIEGKI